MDDLWQTLQDGATYLINGLLRVMYALGDLGPLWISLLAVLVMLGVFGDFRAVQKLKNLPPLLFLTGVMSALMVPGTILLLPKLGAGKSFLLQIVGQIIMAMIVSHFGLLESPQDPITLQKIIGAAFLVVGALSP